MWVDCGPAIGRHGPPRPRRGIAQPRSGDQPAPGARRAVRFSRPMMSRADRSGFSLRMSAAVAATCGAAIDVPSRYA